jgi:hypothetical protein
MEYTTSKNSQPDLHREPRYQALTQMDGRRARRAKQRKAQRELRKALRAEED